MIQKLITAILAIMITNDLVKTIVMKVMIQVMFYSFKIVLKLAFYNYE